MSRAPWLAALIFLGVGAASGDVLWVTEANNLRRVQLGGDAAGPGHGILIEHASRDESGGPSRLEGRRRDVNGMICFLPDGSGRFVAGEDTGQPDRTPGWGLFDAGGRQVGKLVPTYYVPPGEPYGCAFDRKGRLFTSDVGNKGFGSPQGQLLVWFPPFGASGQEPSPGFCKLATDVGTAGGVAIDDAGRVYVASASRFAIHRFSPPFPSRPEDCTGRDAKGSPMAVDVKREVFVRAPYTFTGLAHRDGKIYAASVVTGDILEYDTEGRLLRKVLDPPDWLPLPPVTTGHPQGIAFGPDGSLYYADLDLVWSGLSLDAGPDGKVRRIRFDAEGRPLPPEVVIEGLGFPDGVVVPGPAD